MRIIIIVTIVQRYFKIYYLIFDWGIIKWRLSSVWVNIEAVSSFYFRNIFTSGALIIGVV